MQDDIDDGMDWLVKQGIADAKRVCLVGISYGGYAALWGATRNPERYRCAVSLAGVSDIVRQENTSEISTATRKRAMIGNRTSRATRASTSRPCPRFIPSIG
jgi:dipeptidyl aminopeptidase/acylaminoacyl peptidase